MIATATFGLEALVKRELISLGFDIVQTEDAKVTFKCSIEDIPIANMYLRTADRVYIKMGEFEALSFDELFEKTKALPWDEWITSDAKFTVNGKSIKSVLHSVPDCQSIVKKAVVEKLKQKYHINWFEETGPEYTILVAILKDKVTLTIDTSGVGLHKRGYRPHAVEAPLKETLAAAMIELSYWNKDRILLDPLCGSGTIPIEAALIGKNIAPGINRHFASEEWPQIGESIWKSTRINALKTINNDIKLKIYASDIDPYAIKLARQNALNAGVADMIKFEAKPLSEVKLPGDYGVMICNPPYGERIGERQEIIDIYKSIRRLLKNDKTWSFYILTSDEKFEKLYGRRADRKRKLYNGRIKVDYYQYYGERPPKENK